MATLTDLIRYQKRAKGKSNISSLMTASGQKTLEKIDPRNWMFSERGLATALFPALKGYQAKTYNKNRLDSPVVVNINTKGLEAQFGRMNRTLSRISMNTAYLKLMAKDMNLIRRNFFNLLLNFGITPKRKTDTWFAQAKQREIDYEKKFGSQISTPATTEPEQLKSPEKSSGGGVLGFLGAGILGGLGALFLIPSVRDGIKNFLDSAGTAIFGSEYWNDLKTGIRDRFGEITEIFNNALKALGVTLVGIGAAIVGLKIALSALGAKIWDIVRTGGGLPKTGPGQSRTPPGGPNRQPTPGSPKNPSGIGGKLTLGGIALGTALTMVPSGLVSPESQNDLEKIISVTSGVFALQWVKNQLNRAPTTAKERTLKRIFDLLKRASSQGRLREALARVGTRFGANLAYRLGLMVGGVLGAKLSGMLSLTITAAQYGLLAYDLILIKDFLEKILSENPEMIQGMYQDGFDMNPERSRQVSGKIGEGTKIHETEDGRPILTRPGDGSGLVRDGKELNRGYTETLALIRKYEGAEHGYNALVTEAREGFSKSDLQHSAPLTSMTLAEVLEFQSGMRARGHETTAVGGYQIVKGTLEGLMRNLKLDPSLVFDEQLQDTLARELIREAKHSGKPFSPYMKNIWEAIEVKEGLEQQVMQTFRREDAAMGNSLTPVPIDENDRMVIDITPSAGRVIQTQELEARTRELQNMVNPLDISPGNITNIYSSPTGNQTPPVVNLPNASVVDKDLFEEIFERAMD